MITAIKNNYYKAGALLTTSLAGAVMATRGVSAQCEDITTGGLQGGINCAKPADENVPTDLFGTDGGVFSTITNALLFLVGAISVVMLIVGGIRYVVSAGDQNAVTGAKNTILYAIVGIIVSFLAFAAVNFVTDQLGASST